MFINLYLFYVNTEEYYLQLSTFLWTSRVPNERTRDLYSEYSKITCFRIHVHLILKIKSIILEQNQNLY